MTKERTLDNLFLNLRQGLNSKAQLVPANSDIGKLVTNPGKDWYQSLYLYNEKHKALLEASGSLSGIQDTVTNRLYFDFDSKDDLEKARQDALTTAFRLTERGFPEDTIGCYFTGSKGFSIEVSLNELLTPQQFKAIVFNIAGDLNSFDKIVNDSNRIVRISATKHQSSGLYKIPLTPEELCDLSIPEIKQKASKRRVIETQLAKADMPKELLQLPVEKPIEKSVEKVIHELTFDVSTVDFKTRPKGFDEPRFLLSIGEFEHGERNPAMLCLAATYKNQGWKYEQAEALLTTAAGYQQDRKGGDCFSDKEIKLILDQVYGPNWKGGIFTTRDPNNWLAQYARRKGITVKDDDDSPRTIMGIVPGFVSYMNDLEKNTIKCGIPSLDKALHLMVGMGLAIVAPPSVGKTSLALEILEYNSKAGMQTVFVSLDMSRNRLFQKIVHRVTGMDKDQLYAAFRQGEHQPILDKVKSNFGNVWFMDQSSTNVTKIREFIKGVEQQTGEKVKMVMIDYFERLSSGIADATASSMSVSNEIQDMTNDLNILTICLFQPNKHAYSGGPDCEITNYASIKGSSHIVQSFRAIISLSRPFFTPKTKEIDKFLVANILKSDLGQLDRLELGWEGKRGKIYELEDIERKELHDLMKLKNGKDEDDNDNGGWA